MSEPISILDVIKRGGYEASLITTFNATLPFYEEVVLRKLVSAGCRHNVVLMDRGQCAQAWDSEATRPRLAGYAYTLLPVGVTGAFHPKVCILVGPKKASILIGSHNLTLSGFGYNREITNWIEVASLKDAEGVALLHSVWQMVRQWIELERGKTPESLLESALAFSNFIGLQAANTMITSSTHVLHQTPGSNSLIDQLAEKAAGGIKRIGVIGAFFDNELTFIKELAKRWPEAKIVVGIDPKTVHLSAIPKKGPIRYVDARKLWPKENSYLHAKIVFLEAGVSDKSIFVSGSANPSRPAWMSETASGNVEAVLLRLGKDAQEAAKSTGLSKIFGLPDIDASIFESISRRSKSANVISESSSIPVLLGVSDLNKNEIHIATRGDPGAIDRVIFFGSELNTLEEMSISINDGDEIILRPTVDLDRIRSCNLFKNGEVVVRAMIQHPSILFASSRSSRQYQIRSALVALGSSDGDISKLLATVERVIFAENTTKEVQVAIREHQEKAKKSTTAAGPDTLEVSIADLPKSKKKIRLLKSGDLAYLIDVLLRRLSEGLETQSVETDKSGRTEEEQVGQDDDESQQDSQKAQDKGMTDADIAVAVAKKARLMIRRMIDQLDLAVEDDTRRVGAVFQLIAVLALIRELRHLDKQPRWRSTGQELADEDDRRWLLDASVYYLLGSSTHLMDFTDKVAGQDTDEMTQLRVLLLWLAWDLGEELTEKVNRFWDSEELQAKLTTNALFLKLMPRIIEDKSARADLEQSIARTISPTPQAAIRANKWLKRHIHFGEVCSNGFIDSDELHVGGYCYVPGKVEEPQVVVELSNGNVGFCDFGKIRTFLRNKVIGMTPIGEEI